MMYQNKLVASLKANGKVLREFKDTVYIPFGSEYSILLKNLNTVRAVVNVFIDGENVVPGGLVLNAGQECDLERSIKNNNLNEGNKFKFIERTAAVENHRGVKLEDGLIRIEYQFEIPRPIIGIADHYWKDKQFPYYPPGVRLGEFYGVVDKYSKPTLYGSSTGISQMNVNGALRGVDYSKNGSATAQAASASVEKYCMQNNISLNDGRIGELHDGSAMSMDWCDVGITVPGSKSEQKFQTTYVSQLDPQKYSIVLKILGETPANEPIRKPVTVKHKPKCITCGKQNKANAKFCTECGTALEIFA